MAKTPKKPKGPQDATNRNVRAANKRVAQLDAKLEQHRAWARTRIAEFESRLRQLEGRT